MAIIIRNKEDVLKYAPFVPTYVIRIADCGSSSELKPLLESSNFRRINAYEIHDGEPDSRGNGPIESHVAEKLILDFIAVRQEFNDIQDILAHCNEGRSRGPAVAGALNEIFDLGAPVWRVSVDYPDYNIHVYNQIVKTAREMGVLKN
jgi:predicted protein tyrosine phosphatase